MFMYTLKVGPGQLVLQHIRYEQRHVFPTEHEVFWPPHLRGSVISLQLLVVVFEALRLLLPLTRHAIH